MPAIDPFDTHNPNLHAPLNSAEPVVPSDGADLSHVSRALYVGTEGAVRVLMQDGQTVTFVAMPVGWHPIRVVRVLATGTTASDIVAGW